MHRRSASIISVGWIKVAQRIAGTAQTQSRLLDKSCTEESNRSDRSSGTNGVCSVRPTISLPVDRRAPRQKQSVQLYFILERRFPPMQDLLRMICLIDLALDH